MQLGQAGRDGRLGGAVGVEHLPVRRRPALHHGFRAHFSAQIDQAQGGDVFRKQGQQGRHGVQHRDVVGGQHAGQVFRVAHQVFRAHPQGRADQVGNPDFLEGHVEGDRKTLVDPVLGADAQHGVFAAQEVADAALADQDALGFAGRAGSVDDVGGHVGRDGAAQGSDIGGGGRIGAGLFQQGFKSPDGGGHAVQLGRVGFGRDQADGAGVFHAHQQALDGGVLVDRQPGRARLGDGQLANQQLHPARQPQAHDLARPDAGGHQAHGGARGEPIQFGVAQLALAEDQGQLIGRAARARFEQVGEDFFVQQIGGVRAVQDVGVRSVGGLLQGWGGDGIIVHAGCVVAGTAGAPGQPPPYRKIAPMMGLHVCFSHPYAPARRFKERLRGFQGATLDFAGTCANMGGITVEGMMKSTKASSYAATMVLSAVLFFLMIRPPPAALAQDATTHQVYEAAAAGKFIEAQKMMDQVLADHPNSGKAHFIDAELLAKQGKMARAATALATAERLAPGLKFAKPEAVQHLRSAIASGSAASAANTAGTSIDFSRAPRLNNAAQETPRFSAPAPVEQQRSIPWGMILGIGVLVVLAAMLFRRKAGPAGGNPGYGYGGGGGGGGVPGNYPQYPNGGVPPQAMPPQYGAPGGFGSGGGLGSGIVGGLATGAALGAGMVAGEALAHRFTDSNRGGNEGGSRLGNNFTDTPSVPYEAPPANYDMGGNDFGVDDTGGWDSSGGDSGGGSDWD